MRRASWTEAKSQRFRQPSRKTPLKRSLCLFCYGQPGAVKWGSICCARSQAATCFAMNSGPCHSSHTPECQVMRRGAATPVQPCPLLSTGHNEWSGLEYIYRGSSGTSGAAYPWSRHGRNHDSKRDWDAPWGGVVELTPHRRRWRVFFTTHSPHASEYTAPSHDSRAIALPSAGYRSCGTKIVDIALRAHESAPRERSALGSLAADAWYCGGVTGPNRRVAHLRRASALERSRHVA